MENPNEYEDNAYSRWSIEADNALVNLWEAGASVEDIEEVIANAMENATDRRFRCSLFETG